ncbi:PAS domain S-box protein [Marinomonas communis]|uniref:Sensory/regulatory protein RpfC n=1 Tax=Marinomonas communis TaxID=28254 RepID=A0A4R6XD05_9GAMM|nr:PAS domain S-box protein [Marinomonas communis]TDR15464.1 hypothetical protein C8D85_0829 [Marinomonas communis]
MKSAIRWGVIGLLVAGFFVASSYFLYWVQHQRLLSNHSLEMEEDLIEQRQILLTEIDELASDLRFMLSVPPIQGIIRATDNGGVDPFDQSPLETWKSRLGEIFKSYVSAHESAYQIRYIGIENNGKELVRVDKSESGIMKVAETGLQSKGSRDYYKEITSPTFSGLYISDITLNREQGVIQIPHTPTIRFAIQVYSDSGQLFGFIMVNVAVEKMFQRLLNATDPDTLLYITNDTGAFVMHPDKQNAFAFEFGEGGSVWDASIHQRNDKVTTATLYQTDGNLEGLYASEVIPLVEGKNSITIRLLKPLSSINNEALFNTLYSFIMFLVGMGVFSVFFVIYRASVRSQNELALEKAQINAIVEGSQDAIIGVSMEGRITDWNPSATKMFGFTKEEVLGEYTHNVFLTESTKEEEDKIRQDLLLGKQVKLFETQRQTKSGQVLLVSISASPIRDEHENVVGVSKIVRDISEQKQLEHQLEEFNHMLEQQIQERTEELKRTYSMQSAILDNAAHAVIATDLEGVITLFNPAAESMLEYKQDELVGKLTPKVFHLESEVVGRAKLFSEELEESIDPGFQVFVAKTLKGLKNEHEWTYVSKSGKFISVYLSVTGIYDDKENLIGFLGMATDISELVSNRNRLEALKEQLSIASDIADIGIWSWDPGSGAITWNEKMFEVYDMSPDDSIDAQAWIDMVAEEDRERANKHFERFAEGKGGSDISFDVIAASGKRKTIQASATIEHNPLNNAIKLVGINKDISEQVRYEQALKDAKDASDQANKTKSEFVANMSHEIRTPMNAIIGLLELLGKTSLDEKQLDYVAKSDGAARSLLNILNDILDFSKVEAGKLEIDPHPFSLHDLAENVATVLNANLGDKPIELIIDVDPKLPSFITLDSFRLQQIIINLAGNAIKFTHQGMVQIKFSARTDSALQIDIIDTGIGIPKNKQEKILEAFGQAEASTVREFGGTGLGLIITQKLIDLMGGQFSFVSEEGAGSTFSAVIPYKSSFDENVFTPESQQLNVLIVDDLPEALEACRHIVEGLTWHAETASNGEDAINLIRHHAEQGHHFDLILMDWSMPKMSGWETIVKIRQLGSEFFSGKMFVVTAYGKDAEVQGHYDGEKIVDDIIQKPLSASVLVDRIAEHSLLRVKGSINFSSNMTRLHGYRLLLVEDNSINQLVAREILEAEGAMVDVVANGREAITAVEQSEVPYALVLMDIQMPIMDGYEATRQLRKRYDADTLPIVAMTANAMASDRREALDVGMNDHVSKPFNSADLVRTILKYIYGQFEAPQLNSDCVESNEHHSYPVDMSDGDEFFVPQLALARLGGNQTIFQAALEAYLGDSVELMGGFVSELDETNIKSMAILAHTFKGASATVGADKLASVLKELELQLKNGEIENYYTLVKKMQSYYEHSIVAIELYLKEKNVSTVAEGSKNRNALTDEALAELKELLEHSNMKALKLYDELVQLNDLKSDQNLEGMKPLIDKLSFQEALQWLDKYMASRREA